MNRRGLVSLSVVAALVAAGCGGGASKDAATEEGALEAVRRSQTGLLRGDSDAVLNFLNQECRDSIDEDEIKLALGLVSAFIGDDLELDKIEVSTSIVSFDGDAAEVAVEFELPGGSDLEEWGFEPTTIDVSYENERWVADGCEFSADSEKAAENLREELAALGYAGTREDPVPTGVGVPVGDGFSLSVDAIDTDAAAAVEAGGGYVSEPEPDHRLVMLEVTMGYSGSEEPASIGSISIKGIGGASSTGVDFYGCNGMAGELSSFSTRLLSGGVVTGFLCAEVPVGDIDGLAVDAGPGFGDYSVVFDPFTAATAAAPVVGTSGPSPDGSLTRERENPIAVGTATDIGNGWTLTVNGVRPDGTAVLAAASEYNDPPPAGSEYVLVDVTIDYAGEEESYASSVQLEAAGDSNVVTSGGSCSSSWDESLDQFTEMFSGASVTGEVCFVVDAGDLASLQLLAATGWGEEPSVFALG